VTDTVINPQKVNIRNIGSYSLFNIIERYEVLSVFIFLTVLIWSGRNIITNNAKIIHSIPIIKLGNKYG